MADRFQLIGIDPAPFEALFQLDDAQLRAHGAVRCTADEQPGYPCRVSLEDAEPGAELLLLPWQHQPADTPYRASGPIFVRRGARRRVLPPGEVPPYVTSRLISLRGYDAQHLIVEAEVVDGSDVARAIEDLFGHAHVAYIHLHNARRGCFSCRVLRA